MHTHEIDEITRFSWWVNDEFDKGQCSLLENVFNHRELADNLWEEDVKNLANKRNAVKAAQMLLDAGIINHEELINIIFEKGVMHYAAEHNNVKAVKIFLDAGFSPDACQKDRPKLSPLYKAVYGNAIDVINLLLDAGADIHKGAIDNSASYLTSAANGNNLPLVKFFYEHGVDINAEYTIEGVRFNALKWAVLNGYDEIAAYLKSKGAVWIEDEPGDPSTPEESMLQFLSEKFKSKPLPICLSEIVPASVPLNVHIFPPAKRKRNTTIFVTAGLSDWFLIVPDDKMKYRFAEYILEMPGEWSVSKEALQDEHNLWVINWLKAIGRYPHENQTYYGEEATITTEQIPHLKTPDGDDTYAEVKYDPDLDFIIPQNGIRIVFYRVSLSTSFERHLKLPEK
ncbi:MAG: ankyrin repeat domain-containing protein [Planctomycetaceae bacterium]|jgi:hypothetical protein|nr:ankyrin repeat domain-containing protein [Planctomycetaceae bacterium]